LASKSDNSAQTAYKSLAIVTLVTVWSLAERAIPQVYHNIILIIMSSITGMLSTEIYFKQR